MTTSERQMRRAPCPFCTEPLSRVRFVPWWIRDLVCGLTTGIRPCCVLVWTLSDGPWRRTPNNYPPIGVPCPLCLWAFARAWLRRDESQL